MVGSRPAVPDDIQSGHRAAGAVDQVHWLNRRRWPTAGGIGYLALRLLGWKPQFYVGGMLYCAGPSAIRDHDGVLRTGQCRTNS